MPGFKLPSITIPGLRDMTTDDIRGALSDVRIPDVKVSDLDPRNVELPRVDLSKLDIDLSGISSAMSDAATSVAERNPLRKQRPSRWPLVIGGLIAAAFAVVVVRNATWFRDRATEVGQRIKERSEAARVDESLEPFDVNNGAYSGDIAIPIEPDAYADSLPSAEQPLPTASEELAGSLADRIAEPAGYEAEGVGGYDPDRPAV
jgi:hypothetical protein